MEVIDHIIEIKETLGGLVQETTFIRKQMEISNGRTETLEGRVDILEEASTEKSGGSKVWLLLASGFGAVFLVVLGAFLAFIWK